jgi:hypothetical protein
MALCFISQETLLWMTIRAANPLPRPMCRIETLDWQAVPGNSTIRAMAEADGGLERAMVKRAAVRVVGRNIVYKRAAEPTGVQHP